ncbi:uncharacterized protein LOC110696670 [Chenopodium quinoa]|uniref:uncharacterized protein LOC110696670 n=1 Tax=Chenopodium quinoa TaxID=63459 RepID=UPI000B7882B4|nr:uncharacterized protein LOC110696670 [Chenopodium quinoa]
MGHREFECFSKLKQQGNGNKFTPTSNQGGNSNNKENAKNRNVGNNNSGNKGKNVTPGRLSVMSKKEAERSSDDVTGNFSIHSISVKALFDYGATYSFISSSVVKWLELVEHNSIDLPISLPTGEVVRCIKMHMGLPLRIGETDFPFNFIEFELGDLDVILGMDWLATYKANIDCEIQKTFWEKGIGIISAMNLSKLVSKGYPLFFCSVQDLKMSNKVNVEDVSIVNEFLDVFLEEISGMPPKRELEVTIDLVL